MMPVLCSPPWAQVISLLPFSLLPYVHIEVNMSLVIAFSKSIPFRRCTGTTTRTWTCHGQLNWHRPRRKAQRVLKSFSNVAVKSVPPFVLDPVPSEEALGTEGLWMANMIKCWLDEEWTALEVHGPLSRAAGEAYRRLRQQGQNDASSLVLDLVTQLQGHDFQDSFTNEYEVANKVVELLMLRQGCAVCCASPADLSAIERYQGKLAAKDAEL